MKDHILTFFQVKTQAAGAKHQLLIPRH